MDGGLVDNSLARIERALARIEAAASRPRDSAPGDSELRERHDRLRAAVGQTLRELDQLIANRAP